MRVALDALPLLGHPTGVGNYTRSLLTALARRENVSTSAFAVTMRRHEELAALLPAGVPLRGRPLPARPVRASWERFGRPPFEALVGPVDVVHGTNFTVPPTRRAARVVTVHDLTPWRYPELCDEATLAYPAHLRRVVSEGAWVHTPSEFVADELRQRLPDDAGRVVAVHSGIPPLPPASAGVIPAVGDLERYILAVGTIEPRKDYPSLVAAFDAMAAGRPGLGLVIVGAAGWGAEAVMAAVAASPFAGRIRRPGYVGDADLARLLRDAAVLAYPSVYEGFGFPPLQAMELGVPVVATAAGALPEVLADGADLVTPGDPDALIGALSRVLDDPDHAEALRRRGRARAADYEWDRCAAQTVDLYRRASGGRAGPR